MSQRVVQIDYQHRTKDGTVNGILYPIQQQQDRGGGGGAVNGAAILVSGAGGGLSGPSGVYQPLAKRLQQSGIAALRLDYRFPNHLTECVEDVMSAIEDLRKEHDVQKVVLVGWSFGGAVVIRSGHLHANVVGVATVASQTAGTEGVEWLGVENKSLLLLHGKADTCLPPRCSQQLYSRAAEPKEIVLFDNDGHGLTRHVSEMENKLFDFCVKLLSGGKSHSSK
eukprot:GILJ01018174.1.p1 GENE.GILJ01018174.1~~GILJ01018174.1.p1  ORF type:complete len:224 (-),score=35.96 GILJ01018174.1:140-811(-)